MILNFDVILFFSAVLHSGAGFQSEKDIRNAILSRYNMNKPPPNMLDSTAKHRGVDIGLFIHRIREFSTESNSLTLDGYLYTDWYDERLQWNETPEYDSIRFSPDSVWKPKVAILNRIRKTEEENTEPYIGNPSGELNQHTAVRTDTACTATLKFFPFDVHTCQLVFGVWTRSGDTIEAQSSMDYEQRNWSKFSIENSKWEVLSYTSARQYYTPIQSLAITVPARVFTIVFKRTSPLVALATLTPAVLAVFFGLMPYWISPFTGMGFRLIVAAVGLFIVGRATDVIFLIAPAHQGETPLICTYCFVCSTLIFLSLLQTMLTSYLVRKVTNPPKAVDVIARGYLPQMALRVWGMKKVSQVNMLLNTEEETIEEGNLEDATSDKEEVITYADVALIMDSFGFSFSLLCWVILSFAVGLTES